MAYLGKGFVVSKVRTTEKNGKTKHTVAILDFKVGKDGFVEDPYSVKVAVINSEEPIFDGKQPSRFMEPIEFEYDSYDWKGQKINKYTELRLVKQ